MWSTILLQKFCSTDFTLTWNCSRFPYIFPDLIPIHLFLVRFNYNFVRFEYWNRYGRHRSNPAYNSTDRIRYCQLASVSNNANCFHAFQNIRKSESCQEANQERVTVLRSNLSKYITPDLILQVKTLKEYLGIETFY